MPTETTNKLRRWITPWNTLATALAVTAVNLAIIGIQFANMAFLHVRVGRLKETHEIITTTVTIPNSLAAGSTCTGVVNTGNNNLQIVCVPASLLDVDKTGSF